VPFLPVLWTDPRFPYSINRAAFHNWLPDAHSAAWL
jgi:hypothetical protein